VTIILLLAAKCNLPSLPIPPHILPRRQDTSIEDGCGGLSPARLILDADVCGVEHLRGQDEALQGAAVIEVFPEGLQYAIWYRAAVQGGSSLKAFEEHLTVDEERNQRRQVRELHQALSRTFHRKEDVIVLGPVDINVQIHVAGAPYRTLGAVQNAGLRVISPHTEL
jgi:hypothetical protein